MKQLGPRIGRGAHGEVYKALNVETGEFVALKRVNVKNVAEAKLSSIMVRGHIVHTELLCSDLLHTGRGVTAQRAEPREHREIPEFGLNRRASKHRVGV